MYFQPPPKYLRAYYNKAQNEDLRAQKYGREKAYLTSI
jgi:hypothetical protein